jgi:hypothetical protein
MISNIEQAALIFVGKRFSRLLGVAGLKDKAPIFYSLRKVLRVTLRIRIEP